ncbi:DUF1254 domain-containing protein [Bordetella hinzii]|uniref:DUF1254 domain-containing protein n=1 Tax=Bordetella hinzii TaxID=103855 RepID=UPI0004599FF9|nr:DUF1254 domain-containing protein [Bordetella hinzii]KCB42107.1 PF06863 family protein [Bordetella hinzii 4161]KXA71208.1 hypothetical protein AXA74_19765 [Bordetella hinzii LMG 13501]QDJ32471.1 hypothetical protein CBR68_09165 [Bordetella hinzii]QDJ37047.1 hypothetical protein CBR67_10475 [Bordetella hinzii]QDJ50558.1 hypothetical protein CBR69_09610 [Bordetella hinzii]
MRRLNVAILSLAALFAPLPGPAQGLADPPVPAATAEIQRIAFDAYVYLYPLVSMDLARRQAVSPKASGQAGHAPANRFWMQRAGAAGGAWAHADMLRMTAWLDLSDGPVVISVPPTQGRLYTLTLHDLWSDAFAVLGKRSTGTGRGNYAVVPPGWTAALPPAMQRIDAPTSHVWLQGLLQPGAAAETQALQDGFILTPLQDWNRGAQSMQVKSDPGLDLATPVARQVAKMPADVFFAYGAELLRKNPAHDTDQPMLARLRRLGIAPGQQFVLSKQDNIVQQALRRAAREAPAYIETLARARQPDARGWVAEREAMGAYGSAYLKRAWMAWLQPGAELPEDVLTLRLVTDADGLPIDSGARYVLRFEADELPPGDAFWTLAAFDAQGQTVPNPYRRHSVGDRDPLRYNPDGSLELYLQADPPAEADRANWLPLSGEAVNLLLRIYLPAAAALDGRWNPPVLRAERSEAAPADNAAPQ